MDELIQQLTTQLGIDPAVAKNATGKAMAMLKQHAGDDLFNKISGAIPGASEAAAGGHDEAPDIGGGMLGKLAGMASAALGSSAGSGLELASSLTSAGVGTDQLGGFVQMIVNFLKDKVGKEVVDQILAKFPMLKALLD